MSFTPADRAISDVRVVDNRTVIRYCCVLHVRLLLFSFQLGNGREISLSIFDCLTNKGQSNLGKVSK